MPYNTTEKMFRVFNYIKQEHGDINTFPPQVIERVIKMKIGAEQRAVDRYMLQMVELGFVKTEPNGDITILWDEVYRNAL